MKNKLRMIIIFAAFGIIFGCATTSFAQMESPVVGGYGAAGASDKAVIEAANFAVKAQAKKQKVKIKLLGVNNAEQQVVAGMNYKVCLNVAVTEKGKTAVPQTVEAIVYKNLKQKLALTSWAVAACGEKMPTN